MATILAAGSAPVEATLQAEPSWQAAMKVAIRDAGRLRQLLGLPAEQAAAEGAKQFPVFAPLEFIKRMQAGNPRDPLLLQVLATPEESEQLNRFPAQVAPTSITPTSTTPPGGERPAGDVGLLDPVGDGAAERSPGLLQKYAGRVLLLANGACAIHCRYCFRRHYPYEQLPSGRQAWQPVIDSIAADRTIHEVILSGGDPLTLVDSQLAWLVERLDEIPHVSRLRFHTRLPIVIPQRVTGELLAMLAARRSAVYVVLHCNHANEIDGAVVNACRRLLAAGAVLLNQAVLLRGVNDSVQAQAALCRRLVDIRVLPYYLHQLDRVAGGLHFQVEDRQALEIIAALREQLPGYAVPQLVRELPGQPSKTPV